MKSALGDCFLTLVRQARARKLTTSKQNEERAHKGTKCHDFEEKSPKVRPGVAPKFIFMIYLMYWIWLMNFIYVIHMLYCNHLITHSSSKRNSSGNHGNTLLLPSLPLLLLLLPMCVIRSFQYNEWMT